MEQYSAVIFCPWPESITLKKKCRVLVKSPTHVSVPKPFRAAESKLYIDVGDDSASIIYRDEYNIHLLGMEKLHPFDACKWGNVVKVSKDLTSSKCSCKHYPFPALCSNEE